MATAISGPRVLLKQLRETMAEPLAAQDRLNKIVGLIAENMHADVCSFYVLRDDGALELFATRGLKAESVHMTTLRLGEGLVGLIAAAWFYGRNRALTARAHALRHALMAMALIQAVLGISTLVMVVPLGLALTQQMGALVLFTLSICFAYAVRPAAHTQESLNLSISPAE